MNDARHIGWTAAQRYGLVVLVFVLVGATALSFAVWTTYRTSHSLSLEMVATAAGALIATPTRWPSLLGPVVFELYLALSFFNYYGWRLFAKSSVVAVRQIAPKPVLSGTWKVTLRPHPLDPSSGSPEPSAISGYMVCEQTYSNLQMHLLTAETESELYGEEILAASKDDGHHIVAVYHCKPVTSVPPSPSNTKHDGAMILSCPSRSGLWSGRYFMDTTLLASGNRVPTRSGALDMDDHRPQVAIDYAEATGIFQSPAQYGRIFGLNRPIPRPASASKETDRVATGGPLSSAG